MATNLGGLKVLFINMPLRENALPNTPPNGPGLLAARLRQYGAEPTIIDLNAYRIKDNNWNTVGGRFISSAETRRLLNDHIGRYGEPDIVALSGIITTLGKQREVARICRQLLPDAFIVSGGGLATEIRETLFEWIPELDAISHSEGDDIILVMAEEVLRWKKQDNLNRRRRTIRRVYPGGRPENLDVLPFPAWDLLEKDVWGNPVLEWYIRVPVWGSVIAKNSSVAPFSMQRSLTTVSSRGCPYSCAFCYRGAQGERNYGMRSAWNLREEAIWLKYKYQIDFLGFPDDNFAVDVSRIAELPRAFGDLNLRWGTHTRLDEADERLDLMAQAGCIYIGFGAESASASVLRRMGKGGFMLKRGMTRINGHDFPTTLVEGYQHCLKTGIHGNCTWIMGYPGETLADLKTSVAFILWQRQLVNNSETINDKMFVATAYPGTAMFREKRVKAILSKHFGLQFDLKGLPVPDGNFQNYVLALEDATKLLTGADGQLINYSEMPDKTFLAAREAIVDGQIEKIMDL